jgi:hypothetical protein
MSRKSLGDILDEVKGGLIFLPEVFLYAPADISTVWLRNRVFPRSWKKRVNFLGCRGYDSYHPGKIMCKPAEKYRHKGLFRLVCRHYDSKTHECTYHSSGKR